MKLNKLYNTLSGRSDDQLVAIAQQLDAQSGTTAFTKALANDPEGFVQNILPHVQ